MDAVFAQIKARRLALEGGEDEHLEEASQLINSNLAHFGGSSSRLRRLSLVRKMSARMSRKNLMEDEQDPADVPPPPFEPPEDDEEVKEDEIPEPPSTARLSFQLSRGKNSTRSFKNLPPPPPEKSASSRSLLPPPPPSLPPPPGLDELDEYEEDEKSVPPPDSQSEESLSHADETTDDDVDGQAQSSPCIDEELSVSSGDDDGAQAPLPAPAQATNHAASPAAQQQGEADSLPVAPRLQPHQPIPEPPPLPEEGKASPKSQVVVAPARVPATPASSAPRVPPLEKTHFTTPILAPSAQVTPLQTSMPLEAPKAGSFIAARAALRSVGSTSQAGPSNSDPPTSSSLPAIAGSSPLSVHDVNLIKSELEKLRSATIDASKTKDQELAKANQEIGKTKEALSRAQAENSDLGAKVRELSSTVSERDNLAKENEALRDQISHLQSQLSERRALEEQVENLRAELMQARIDNQRIVQQLVLTVGGKEKLIELIRSPKVDEKAEAKDGTCDVIVQSTCSEHALAPTSDVYQTRFVIPEADQVPAATVSTRRERAAAPCAEVPCAVGTMRRHKEYALALENRVDRLREALHVARERERHKSRVALETGRSNVQEWYASHR